MAEGNTHNIPSELEGLQESDPGAAREARLKESERHDQHDFTCTYLG